MQVLLAITLVRTLKSTVNNYGTIEKNNALVDTNYNIIENNTGMMKDKKSVNIYTDKGYVMDYFSIHNPCMIGSVPEKARYCFNINNN